MESQHRGGGAQLIWAAASEARVHLLERVLAASGLGSTVMVGLPDVSNVTKCYKMVKM
jgi:hypothetical protein